MNESCDQYLAKLVTETHLDVALDARKSNENACRILLEKRKLPENGWSDFRIEQIVRQLAALDSNNFVSQCGAGEREARIACNLVAQRHYGFGHGIGRSGDLAESQPKAVGSSILNRLTNEMLLHLLKIMGIRSAKKCILIPMATGMTLALCLATFKKQRPNAKYVLWSRIDQKSCFKSILVANLEPIIIDTVITEVGFTTNVLEFEEKINEIGAENIVCIFSTTSCFAPRQCDRIFDLGKMAHRFDIPHLVNNAYGLQSKWICNKIEHAHNGPSRVDLFVQSTDKNLMVPVGGSIIGGFDSKIIEAVSKNYAGRASSSQTLDVFMTLLSLGRNGYLKLVEDRCSTYDYLVQSLTNSIESNYDVNKFKSLSIINNPISVIYSLDHFRLDEDKMSMIGSMLFKRGVSGSRVVTTFDCKTIDGYEFKGWGSHTSKYAIPYITFAAAVGMKPEEVDRLVEKLGKIFSKLKEENVTEPKENVL